MPFPFLYVFLVLILVYLHTQHSVIDELPQVDPPLGSATAALEIGIEGLVVDESLVHCRYMGHDLHLLGFLTYRLTSWILRK